MGIRKLLHRVGLTNTARKPRKSYAHSAEDLVLRNLMKSSPKGFYVDIGCHHPIDFSNTYLLSRRSGWRGLVVDADPTYLPLFKRVRPRDTTVNVGIGAQRSRLGFFRVEQYPALNTFSREVADSLRARGLALTEIEIEVLPLSDLLAQHDVGAIDLLNVDVEGLDLEVLQGNDWSRWRPRWIAVEDHGIRLDSPESSPTFRFLRAQGYSLHSKCNYTSMYQDLGAGGAVTPS